ncbi:hypothetical protein SpCBS45565_g03630 [Spizellomyces sp. 'palustris']|nr:hypothetical protein SpCBS45565_g03630 [Spizellomyces sp. 'palustris']
MATLTEVSEKYRPGHVVHGFKVQNVRKVPEFDLTAIQLKHEKTGAGYLHVFKDDSNNVFNVGFHTPVNDSTGVPHILEHTTLCGSNRFPVRDPFFKMLNRSMATFMNALTGNDYTMYPFSTENPVDFRNLMDVYMDSTFAPLLRELDFKQEGWRLEHEDPKDPSTPIIFKGVVYNEMKGVLSDVGSLFAIRAQQHFYPGTTYSHVSGGDPLAITDLTHSQLVGFHKTHYHPSNTRFFTYGTFPLEAHLKAIDDRIAQFAPIPPPQDPEMKPFAEPKRIRVTCPPDPMSEPDKQTKMAVAFLSNKDTDVFESFAMRVLTSLLMDGAASPMFKALIEPNIGSDYSVTTGYNQHTKMTNVSFGLQGIRSEDVDMVEGKIMDVLRDAARTGFDPERVESIIHQTELGLKHRNANFGMMVGQQVMSHWVHGGDPLEFLEVGKHIQQLRASLAKPKFFESMIEKYFLNNQHRMIFIMEPDERFSEELAETERKKLDEMVNNLSPTEKQKIFEDGVKLTQSQEAIEDVSSLPTLTIADIAQEGKQYPVVDTPVGSSAFPVQWRTTATNGVSYVSIVKAIEKLPQDLKEYLPLFSSSLPSIGTQRKSLPVLDETVRMFTGGISASVSIRTDPASLAEAGASLTLSSSCLDKNISPMYELMTEIASEAAWGDLERLRTVVLTAASDASQGVVQSGHRYAMLAAGAEVTKAMNQSEVLGGLTQVGFLGRLARNGVNSIQQISGKLQEIANFIAKEQTSSKGAVITVDSARDAHQQGMSRLVDTLGWQGTRADRSGTSEEYVPTYGRTFVPLPVAVNFSAKSYLGVPYTHPDSAALQVLASLMTHRFLHREIREKGGAYGGGASYSNLDGTLSFWSYRDPSGGLERTLQAYDRAVEWALDINRHLGQQELDEAKLSIFQNVDAPISAAGEGMLRFRAGITFEMQQARRERLFAVTLSDVKDAAAKYLAGRPSAVAVLGGEEEGNRLIQNSQKEWKVVNFAA